MKRGGRRRRGGTPSRSKKRIVSAENSLRGMSKSDLGRVRVNTNITAPKGWKSKGSAIQHTAPKRGITGRK